MLNICIPLTHILYMAVYSGEIIMKARSLLIRLQNKVVSRIINDVKKRNCYVVCFVYCVLSAQIATKLT